MKIPSHPISRSPLPGTAALAALSGIGFGLTHFTEGGKNLLLRGSFSLAHIEKGEWWRVFSHCFLHADPPHLLWNMTALFQLGPSFERKKGALGILKLTLLSGLVQTLFYSLLSRPENENWLGKQTRLGMYIPGVGLSGVLFGMCGALDALEALRRRISFTKVLSERSLPFLISRIALPALFSGPGDSVGHLAHLSGYISGLLLVYFDGSR